jgi:glycosyltransferase involved in cell wall biosynthesis
MFFHEDQLTYPARPGKTKDPEFGAINVLSALSADACCFVTHWAQDAFFEAILQTGFDHADGVVHWLSGRSVICPVGCDFDAIDAAREKKRFDHDRPLHILWSHRHDHDKNPQVFFCTVAELADEGLDFRVSILGMECLDSTLLLEETVRRLGNRLVHRGFLNGAAYACALTQADVVVSCAFQETQGLAVIEAVRAGCRPLLPRRLCYPEIFGDLPAALFYENRSQMKKVLRDAIQNPSRIRDYLPMWPQMERFSWRHVAPRFDLVIDAVCRTCRSERCL